MSCLFVVKNTLLTLGNSQLLSRTETRPEVGSTKSQDWVGVGKRMVLNFWDTIFLDFSHKIRTGKLGLGTHILMLDWKCPLFEWLKRLPPKWPKIVGTIPQPELKMIGIHYLEWLTIDKLFWLKFMFPLKIKNLLSN